MKNQTNRLLAAGELLWDMLPEGKRCGGATANIVFHAAMQGMDAMLCSAVGNDADGVEMQDFLTKQGLKTAFIAVNGQPTGLATVQLQNGIPKFTIHEPSAWDAIVPSKAAFEFASTADAFCFGTLGQRDPRSSGSILALASAVPVNALCVFDVNLRQKFYSEENIRESLQRANVLKVSDEELPVLREMFRLSASDNAALKEILEMFRLRFILYTLGGNGSLFFDGKDCIHQGIISAGPVADTVGCGDSFLASFLASYLKDGIPEKAMHHAAEVSGMVASRSGAMPTDPEFRRKAQPVQG